MKIIQGIEKIEGYWYSSRSIQPSPEIHGGWTPSLNLPSRTLDGPYKIVQVWRVVSAALHTLNLDGFGRKWSTTDRRQTQLCMRTFRASSTVTAAAGRSFVLNAHLRNLKLYENLYIWRVITSERVIRKQWLAAHSTGLDAHFLSCYPNCTIYTCVLDSV